MIESIDNFSFWQLLTAAISFIAIIYIIIYVTSKAFFSAYYECKKNYTIDIGKITNEMNIKIEKAIIEKMNEGNKEDNSGMVNEIFSLIKKEGERLDQQLEEEKKEATNA